MASKTTFSDEKFGQIIFYAYIYTNRIRHASRKISEPGRVICFYMSTIRLYTKQPLSIADQIQLLKDQGLQFDDEVYAAKFLSEVSYFKFVQYLRPMEAIILPDFQTTAWCEIPKISTFAAK